MTFEMPVGEWVNLNEEVIEYLRNESNTHIRWYLLARNGWEELEIGRYHFNPNNVHHDGFLTTSSGTLPAYMVQMVMPFENPKYKKQ